MDISLNTIKRFNENTFLYSQAVESSRLAYYHASIKPHNLYFLGNKMLLSIIVVYPTLKAFFKEFASMYWMTDIYEIRIKKEHFAIYNRGVYKYGYNSLVPVFVYDNRRGEFLIDSLVFYDNKSTLYFIIRKYIMFFIMSRVSLKINIRLISEDELRDMKIKTVKRTTNDSISLLNKLNISLNAEVGESETKQMKQTQKDEFAEIPF